MANKTVYLTVRVTISNPTKKVITDEDANEVISEVDYQFNTVGDWELDTEICGISDNPQ